MNLSTYQIVVPLASFVAIFYAWSLAFRQRKTIWEVNLWTLFWIGIAAIAIEPDLLSFLTRITGIKDRENAVIVISIGIIFFIIFYMVIRLEQLEQRQTRLIRRIALDEAKLDEVAEKKEKKAKGSEA